MYALFCDGFSVRHSTKLCLKMGHMPNRAARDSLWRSYVAHISAAEWHLSTNRRRTDLQLHFLRVLRFRWTMERFSLHALHILCADKFAEQSETVPFQLSPVQLVQLRDHGDLHAEKQSRNKVPCILHCANMFSCLCRSRDIRTATSEIHSDWPVGVKSISQAGGYLGYQLGFVVLDYNR